jgi:predicted  nucleic acid-binding Zn-ribbon protein
MPHVCTRCNNIFESGEDILKGCPACGWKKFMFVRKMSQGSDASGRSSERIITRAMGVRVPPRRSEKESTAIEKTMPLARDPEPSLPLSTLPSTPSSTNLDVTPESELSKGDGRALESIKITAPGTYELNLPSLFERDELIMAVKEGTYFIDLTSAFKKSKKD